MAHFKPLLISASLVCGESLVQDYLGKATQSHKSSPQQKLSKAVAPSSFIHHMFHCGEQYRLMALRAEAHGSRLREATEGVSSEGLHGALQSSQWLNSDKLSRDMTMWIFDRFHMGIGRHPIIRSP